MCYEKSKKVRDYSLKRKFERLFTHNCRPEEGFEFNEENPKEKEEKEEKYMWVMKYH